MIEMNEYAKRRKILLQKIGAKGLGILPAAKEVKRNGDADYPYRQQSDFYYLTGFNEPEAILVLSPKRAEGEFILFNRPRNRDSEIWTGQRAGQEGARQYYQADQAFPIEEFTKLLPELMEGRDALYYLLGVDAYFDKLLLGALNNLRGKIRSGVHLPQACIDIALSLHEMRIFKSKSEIAVLQRAIAITRDGHLAAMKKCRPGQFEYQLEAELTYAFTRAGAQSHAYTPIVGSGPNSCILHYVANNRQIVDGDLVLIDAGAEYQNYAADITRTFPANGKFSGEQRAIYELVLEAQLAAIAEVKPGKSWMAPQIQIVKILTQGLIDLGILKGDVDNLIEKKAYFPFYMHRSGHWLGLDVHDVGNYTENGRWRHFAPGMVLTIEPGLYISSDLKNVPKRWHNIGIRIEDDLLVTAKGHEVLSHDIPKHPADIEAVMA